MASLDEYVVSGPELIEPISHEPLSKTVYQYLKNNYDLPIAMVDSVTRKHLSYKTVFDKSLQLARSLQVCGITPNDTIAISSENNVNYALPLIAGFCLGTTVTLFNPLYTAREIVHVATISKPRVIFCSKVSIQLILEARKQLQFVEKIIIIDGTEPNVETMENFMSINSHGYQNVVPAEVDVQQVAVILYSSGTTGLPKGVMLTHYNFNFLFTNFRDPRLFVQRIPGKSTALGMLPFFHGYGMVIFTISLLLGKTVIVMPKFEESLFLKTVQDYKIKSLYIVPTIANFLAYGEVVDNYDLSHIETITTGAAPLAKRTEEQLLNRFKPNLRQVRQGYGLTETTAVATLPFISFTKLGTVGKPLAGTFGKILDIDTGKSLAHDKPGELCFAGPHIMKGYASDINSTNSMIDTDGWLHSGDIGYYDKEGCFYVVGRLKELIKYKGFQVPPAELEAILLEHPKIADAAVIGLPDKIAGELPLAFVVKRAGQNLNEDEVKNFIAKHVTPTKYLRGGVKFINEIPKNAGGKILRKELQLLVQKSKM